MSIHTFFFIFLKLSHFNCLLILLSYFIWDRLTLFEQTNEKKSWMKGKKKSSFHHIYSIKENAILLPILCLESIYMYYIHIIIKIKQISYFYYTYEHEKICNKIKFKWFSGFLRSSMIGSHVWFMEAIYWEILDKINQITWRQTLCCIYIYSNQKLEEEWWRHVNLISSYMKKVKGFVKYKHMIGQVC